MQISRKSPILQADLILYVKSNVIWRICYDLWFGFDLVGLRRRNTSNLYSAAIQYKRYGFYAFDLLSKGYNFLCENAGIKDPVIFWTINYLPRIIRKWLPSRRKWLTFGGKITWLASSVYLSLRNIIMSADTRTTRFHPSIDRRCGESRLKWGLVKDICSAGGNT